LSLVASSSDPVVRCQLRPERVSTLKVSVTAPASRVITSIYFVPAETLGAVSSGFYFEARVFIHASCRS